MASTRLVLPQTDELAITPKGVIEPKVGASQLAK